MKRKNSVFFLTRGAAVAAIYVLLTYLSYAFGLSSGVIQLRLSEALCVLPAFFAEAIPGLAVGCFIANLLTGCAAWDVVFGTLATLVGAAGSALVGHLAKSKLPRLKFLIPLPTVISNSLTVPFVLRYAYGAPNAIWILMLSVAAGEIISAWILGDFLYLTLEKRIFRR